MRDLKYNPPRKLTVITIEDGKEEKHGYDKELYYCRYSVVYTRYNVVTVMEFDWQTNFGKSRFTVFKTVKEGILYSADLAEGRLSERQVKWLATHFAKTIHENPPR